MSKIFNNNVKRVFRGTIYTSQQANASSVPLGQKHAHWVQFSLVLLGTTWWTECVFNVRLIAWTARTQCHAQPVNLVTTWTLQVFVPNVQLVTVCHVNQYQCVTNANKVFGEINVNTCAKTDAGYVSQAFVMCVNRVSTCWMALVNREGYFVKFQTVMFNAVSVLTASVRLGAIIHAFPFTQ